LTEIIVQDREEFSSPLDRGQLNGDPVVLNVTAQMPGKEGQHGVSAFRA
jgi:hypothetical protein